MKPEFHKEKWCQQLATALEFIHQQNVLHGDLKPENILVDDAENLKIVDVGIAKARYICPGIHADICRH